MKLAIIADDLTGANDSGVMLAKYGINTSVFINKNNIMDLTEEAVIFDTDSRADDSQVARKKVEDTTKYLIAKGYENIYKKIDSTMRGNIGDEILGFHNVIQSDFVFIVPGFPINGRKVINGNHYLNGKLLNETEIANDPVTPVKESFIPKLLEDQIHQKIGLISFEDLNKDIKHIYTKLSKYKDKNVTFIVIDSRIEEDLERILQISKQLSYSISWVGSAGLASYLPEYFNIKRKKRELIIKNNYKPILTVIGSVNINSRKQLDKLLDTPNIFSIKLDSFKAVSDDSIRKEEMSRIYYEAKKGVEQGKDIVIYTAGKEIDIELAREKGKIKGLNNKQTSLEIVKMLGAIVSPLIEENYFQGLVITGGDTVKQIATQWDISGFRLYDELQLGVPITSFIGVDGLYVITKAGGFGKEDVFVRAIEKLKGGDLVEQ